MVLISSLRNQRVRLGAALALSAMLTGCFGQGDGPAEVAFFGSAEKIYASGSTLSPADQQIAAATQARLVRMNAQGEVIAGLAERWVITDDGLGYIFRLRNTAPEGHAPISGEVARDAIIKAIARQKGTALGVDLGIIADIRAMTGRVIDIRLKSPMPEFLHLLAQPELGLEIEGGAYAPMTLSREADVAVLRVSPPDHRGFPDDPDWQESFREVRVRTLSGQKAVDGFDSGAVDTLIGGTIANLPMADLGPLSRGTVRLDGVRGLLGIRVMKPQGFLADDANREVLAMAIDRGAIKEQFNIDGWLMTTRLVPPGLPGDSGTIGERWSGVSMSARYDMARERVSGWAQRHGGEAVRLTIALPEGPGADIIYQQLKDDWGKAGISLERVRGDEGADLRLLDAVARYDSPSWYLNQFNCKLNLPLCSERADRAAAKALTDSYTAERSENLAIAEEELTKLNAYIPIGAPVRWSLVRSDVSGYAQNRWAMHPLFPLAIIPK